MKKSITFILAIVMIVGVSLIGASATAEETVRVEAYSGNYVGTLSGDIASFKNITYATAKRWQPSELAGAKAQDAQDIDCTGDITTIPFQSVRGDNPPPMSEDEIKLDVYFNNNGNTDKAVLVFCSFGGGTGSNSNGVDYSEFLSEYPDIIIVNATMRVSYFGCIDFSDFDDYEEYKDTYKYSNNLGRLDFVNALKWVSENIEFFGGDKDSVTITGGSAGRLTCPR